MGKWLCSKILDNIEKQELLEEERRQEEEARKHAEEIQRKQKEESDLLVQQLKKEREREFQSFREQVLKEAAINLKKETIPKDVYIVFRRWLETRAAEQRLWAESVLQRRFLKAVQRRRKVRLYDITLQAIEHHKNEQLTIEGFVKVEHRKRLFRQEVRYREYEKDEVWLAIVRFQRFCKWLKIVKKAPKALLEYEKEQFLFPKTRPKVFFQKMHPVLHQIPIATFQSLESLDIRASHNAVIIKDFTIPERKPIDKRPIFKDRFFYDRFGASEIVTASLIQKFKDAIIVDFETIKKSLPKEKYPFQYTIWKNQLVPKTGFIPAEPESYEALKAESKFLARQIGPIVFQIRTLEALKFEHVGHKIEILLGPKPVTGMIYQIEPVLQGEIEFWKLIGLQKNQNLNYYPKIQFAHLLKEDLEQYVHVLTALDKKGKNPEGLSTLQLAKRRSEKAKVVGQPIKSLVVPFSLIQQFEKEDRAASLIDELVINATRLAKEKQEGDWSEPNPDYETGLEPLDVD